MAFMAIFLLFSTQTSTASYANTLTLDDLHILQDNKNYKPVGYDEIVGNMAATVYESVASSFVSAYVTPSKPISATLGFKTWFDHNSLYNKIDSGTATMNDLASNPFTMQYAIALPLLNTRPEHYEFALDELSRAFDVPTGPDYYDFLERDYGIPNRYKTDSFSLTNKIKWDFPKVEFPSITFPNSQSKLTSPNMDPFRVGNTKISSPNTYNINYNRVSTPSPNYNNFYSPSYNNMYTPSYSNPSMSFSSYGSYGFY